LTYDDGLRVTIGGSRPAGASGACERRPLLGTSSATTASSILAASAMASRSSGSTRACISRPTRRGVSYHARPWIAGRVYASYDAQTEAPAAETRGIAAHTSAVQVLVSGSRLFSEPDSMAVLDQIQGAIAYVDTIAPRAEARRSRELRATLEAAYNRLHQRMHAAGIYHRHPSTTPPNPTSTEGSPRETQ
jgi:hypothetical protein